MFTKIIPAIMPKDWLDIRRKVASVVGAVTTVQLDIMDGQFVPNETWPYINPNDDYWMHLQNEQTQLPLIEGIDYELDLMIHAPEQHLREWLMLEPSRIITHIESVDDIELLVEYYNQLEGILERGISLDNTTSLDYLEPIIEHVDFVQVMGISKIGFQGQLFDSSALVKIEEIKEAFPGIGISIDGAVNIGTIAQFAAAGTDRYVVGSAIFDSGDSRKNIKELAKALQRL